MKFSFGNKNNIEQSFKLTVKKDDIEKDVNLKLKQIQKDAKVKGFRKGKAPSEVIKSMYEPEVRQDVIHDLVRKSFYAKAQEQSLRIVGTPNLEPESLIPGKDVIFTASFEIYPEITVSNLNKLTFESPVCQITDEDLDKTISNLQKRMCKWQPVDSISKEGMQVKIDFKGAIEGEEFEGGSAKDFVIEIGTNSMIEGFEEGLKDLKKGDTKTLDLIFPEDYGKKDLAGKKVKFEVDIKDVLEAHLPKLDSDFFKSTGIEVKSIDDYKEEVKNRLNEDLGLVVLNKIKNSLFESLLELNKFEIPSAMLSSEIENMKKDSAMRMGMDPKDMDESLFPNDIFEEEASKRVKIGVILNKIIEDKDIKPDASKVKELIEERAKNYKEPQQVINYLYSDEQQLKNIEAISLEEQIIDILKKEAKSKEIEMSYEECVQGK